MCFLAKECPKKSTHLVVSDTTFYVSLPTTMPTHPAIQAINGGITIKVSVVPRSSVNKVVGEHNGAVKVALTAPPVEGAANKALVEFLARLLGIPKSSISIVSGETSRRKTVQALGADLDFAVLKLGLGEHHL